MARKKELFVVVLVDELPTKGDNYHIYMLKDDDGITTANYYTNGSWVSFVFDITAALKLVDGYAATGTKVLKSVNGEFSWV